MKGDIFYFEFLGLPGAGKTTLKNKVLNKLNPAGFKTYSNDCMIRDRAKLTIYKRGFHLLWSIATNIGSTFLIMCYPFFIKPLNFMSFKYAYKAVRTLSNIEFAKKTASIMEQHVVLFDQGLLQDIWSIGVTGQPRNSTLSAYLRIMLQNYFNKVGTKVIFLDVSPEIASIRIQNREYNKYRFDRMAPDVAKMVLTKKVEYLHLILKSVSFLKGCDKKTLNNKENHIGSQAEKIYQFIHNAMKIKCICIENIEQ